MSYDLYRASVGIDNAAMIAALHEKFPCYGKATQSMINNPEKYAACLTPEAEAHLVSTFGPGPGLVSVKDRPQKRRPRRAKPNRLVVYLPDELYEKVRQLMTACGFATVQEFLETSLTGIVEEAGKKRNDLKGESMTRIENIKAQIAAASVEEFAEILVDPDELFTCRKCELFKSMCPDICDFECKKHCINWLNSEVEG